MSFSDITITCKDCAQPFLFTATCSQCGQEARVPFQPRGDKPVYCSSCFETKRPARRY